jgi:hypothetical protein
MGIGTRVRLTQDVDNYPTCLIRTARPERSPASATKAPTGSSSTSTIPNWTSGTTNWKSGTGLWTERSITRKASLEEVS